MNAPTVTPRTPDGDDAPFTDPWCQAARRAGLAPWVYEVAADRLTWSTELHGGLGYPQLPSAPTVRWWMTQLHPEDAPHAALTYDAVGAGRLEEWSLPYRLKRADGGWATVTDIGHAIRDDAGQLVRLVGYVVFR